MRLDDEKRKKNASSADDPLAEAVVTLAMEHWQQDIAEQLDEEPAAEEHRFSEQHQAELEDFFADLRCDEHRDKRHKRIRRWASVAALLLLCALPLSVEASRSIILRTVERIGEGFLQFLFLVDDQPESEATLEDAEYWQLTMKPSYLPDGFMEQHEKADAGKVSYLGPDGAYIIFRAAPISGHAPAYDTDDYCMTELKTETLTGWAFESLDESKAHMLVWVDDAEGVIYDLYGYVSLDELIKMAESLTAIDPE